MEKLITFMTGCHAACLRNIVEIKQGPFTTPDKSTTFRVALRPIVRADREEWLVNQETT